MQHSPRAVGTRIVVHKVDVIPVPADLHEVPRVPHLGTCHDRAFHAELAHHPQVKERICLADAGAGLEEGIGIVDHLAFVVGVGRDEIVVDVERLFRFAEALWNEGDDVGNLFFIEGRCRLAFRPVHRILKGDVHDDVRKQPVRRVIRDARREEKELRCVCEEVGVDPHEIFHRDAVFIEVERLSAGVDCVRRPVVDLVVGHDRLAVSGHDAGCVLRVCRHERQGEEDARAEEGDPSFHHRSSGFPAVFHRSISKEMGGNTASLHNS